MDTMITPDPLPSLPSGTTPAEPDHSRRSPWRTAWASVRAAIGALLGLVPHVMHHIGILAGAALLTGVLGNAVLFAAGLLLSLPLLKRLQKRFGTWKAPVIGVVVFTAMFLLSALVVGPAITGSGTRPAPQSTVPATSSADHEGHHGP